MKSYCIVLPYRYRPGYIYLHRYMCHIINISPKSSSSFWPANVFCSSHYCHIRGSTGIAFTFSWTCRLYSFLSLCGHSVFFCYLAKVSYYKRFSTSHELFGCDLTTNARLMLDTLLRSSNTKNISLCKYSVSWVKKMLYLFTQQFFIYLQTADKLRSSTSLRVAALLPITTTQVIIHTNKTKQISSEIK